MIIRRITTAAATKAKMTLTRDQIRAAPVFRHAGHYLIGDPRRVSIGWRAACGKARVILLRLACLVRAGPASATRGRNDALDRPGHVGDFIACKLDFFERIAVISVRQVSPSARKEWKCLAAGPLRSGC